MLRDVSITVHANPGDDIRAAYHALRALGDVVDLDTDAGTVQAFVAATHVEAAKNAVFGHGREIILDHF